MGEEATAGCVKGGETLAADREGKKGTDPAGNEPEKGEDMKNHLVLQYRMNVSNFSHFFISQGKRYSMRP